MLIHAPSFPPSLYFPASISVSLSVSLSLSQNGGRGAGGPSHANGLPQEPDVCLLDSHPTLVEDTSGPRSKGVRASRPA